MSCFKAFWNKVENYFGRNPADVVIIYSDRFEVMTLENLRDDINSGQIPIERLLDIRVFDNNGEIRIYRDYIGNSFNEIVELKDKDMEEEGVCSAYDDMQFLDVDLKRSNQKSGFILATGGGTYRFPHKVTENTKIRIRNYVMYDDNGQAYIAAWRLVGFEGIGGV